MTPRTQPAVEAAEQLIDAANQTPAAQTSEPQTAAGRAVAAWSESDVDPLDEYGFRTLRQAVLAIEAEAAALASPPPALEPDAASDGEAVEALAPWCGDILDEAEHTSGIGFATGKEMAADLLRHLAARGYRLVRSQPDPGGITEPASAQAVALGLDVERLARAFRRSALSVAFDSDAIDQVAADLAAAYAEGEPSE